MSGKIFDLTPESEGPRHPVRRAVSWDYGSSAEEVHLARTLALARAAEEALLGAQLVVRRRAARGQTGGEDAVTLALTRPLHGYGARSGSGRCGAPWPTRPWAWRTWRASGRSGCDARRPRPRRVAPH